MVAYSPKADLLNLGLHRHLTNKGKSVFGLFKKKEANRPAPSTNENIIDKAVVLLDLQLTLCRSQDGYLSSLDSKPVRGYLVGFFDCALQKLGHPVRSDEEFAMLLVHGHSQLLSSDLGDTQRYTFASLRLQDDSDFARGQAEGGNECDGMLTGKTTRALGLARYFMQD